jgi:hypothetical protein
MRKLSTVCLFLFLAHCSLAQDDEYYKIDRIEAEPKVNIGLGIGLDYGGIGGRITFLPIRHIAVFAALGYPFVDFGYNLGAQLRIIPDKRLCPTVGVMYGYNGVIKVQNASAFDKIYYGVSLSAGLEIHFKGKANFLNVELVVPFRSQAFHDDWDKVKQLPNISIEADPLPIAFSIGYHFAFK